MSVFRVQDNRLSRTFRVRSYEVDAGGRLALPTLLHFLQETASLHAFELGVSVQQLSARQHTWVLSRMALKVWTYPCWKDRIHVHTWPCGTRRAFALRDFDVRDDADRPIAAAVSAWLIIDMQKRRPVRLPAFFEKLHPSDKRHVFGHALDKLPAPVRADRERVFRVRYHDLDINGHVNNVSYLTWLLEGLRDVVLSDRQLSELEINFTGEARYGDSVLTACDAAARETQSFRHAIRRQSDDGELVRAQTTWIQR